MTFGLSSAVARSQTTIRVTFTDTPGESALAPSRYTLSGPGQAVVLDVSEVYGDATSVDLETNRPLVEGTWLLAADGLVQSADDESLTSPASVSFNVVVPGFLYTGATNDTAFDIIRKHLPSAYKGRAWNALIGALAAGDDANFAAGRDGFDQGFLTSADGEYLDRKASDSGTERPRDLGMSDDLFRQFAIRSKGGKVAHRGFEEILETFYGAEAVSAVLTASSAGPYALTDGWTLKVKDARTEVEVVFDEDRFDNITQATADAVASFVSDEFRRLSFAAYAETLVDPVTGTQTLRIRNKALGLDSKLSITGGLAQNVFGFQEEVETGVEVGMDASVSVPEAGVGRLAIVGETEALLLSVRAGDYANVTDTSLLAANRGSFVVQAVYTEWTGAAYTQYVDLANTDATAEGAAALVTTGGVRLFRPVVTTPATQGPATVVAQGEDAAHVILPATTRAVSRTLASAGYLQPRRLLDATSLLQAVDGNVYVTTDGSHGLSVGDWVILDDFVVGTSLPATDPGDPSP